MRILLSFDLRILFAFTLLFQNCYLTNSKFTNRIDRSVGISQKQNDSLPFASGLIVSEKEVLTVYHAVMGHENDLVVFDGTSKKRDLQVIKSEVLFDLSLLRCEECNFNFHTFDSIDRNDLKIGDKIYLFGSPYRLSHSYKEGYISNLDRSGIDPTYPNIPFIQSYGISDPGNSGAGVFTMESKFIGIQRANFGYQPGGEVGLIIPSGFVNVFLEKSR